MVRAAAVACAVIVVVATRAHAVPLALPDPSWSGQVSASASPGEFVTGPGTFSDSSLGSLGQVTGTATPNPSLTATASQDSAAIGASSVIELVYDLGLSFDGLGSPAASVPILMIGKGGLSATNSAEAFVELFVDSAGVANLQNINGVPNTTFSLGLTPGFDPASFDIAYALSLAPEQIITVDMYLQADVNAGPGPQASNAFLDPYFYIDPTFADAADYSLQVSRGIGNSPSAVPLPAALPLFAFAVGGLGIFGRWRRRRGAMAGAA
jgi:hypothetical protein